MKTPFLPFSLAFLVGCASAGPRVAASDYSYEYSEAPEASLADDYEYSQRARATTASVESDDDVGGGGFFDFLKLGSSEAASPRPVRMAEAPAAPKPPPPPPAPGSAPADEPAVADDRLPEKRLMIYRATYNIMVANVDDSVKQLVTKAEAMGGYLQSRADGTVTVRVPAARFFELTGELGGFGLITNESLEALDVTKEYVDLALRLDTAEQSRARLVKLLEQATKMEDILRIESELRRLTAEIESMKGQLRLLADQVAFSTLTVRFYSNAPPPKRPSPQRASRFPWINAVGIEQVMYGF